MIFLDTSAIYALADRADLNHQQALAAFQQLLEEGEDVLVHSYVLVEAAALLQRRLGLASAFQFLQESRAFAVHWIGAHDHEEAVALLEEHGKRGLSLVDCASFAVMRRHRVERALAFDAGFEAEGFVLYRFPGDPPGGPAGARPGPRGVLMHTDSAHTLPPLPVAECSSPS